MVLPIMQFDRFRRKGVAGQVSDSSLLDSSTGFNKTEAVRHGTIVEITGVDGSDGFKDNFAYATLATAAAGAAAKRLAIVGRSLYDTTQSRSNGVAAGAPANLIETGRVWVLLKDGVTVVPQGPVSVAPPATSGALNGVKGTVDNGATNPVRGLVFTGRVDKYAVDETAKTPVYINVAEVQIRPQTA